MAGKAINRGGGIYKLECGCIIPGSSVPRLCPEGERLADAMDAAYRLAARTGEWADHSGKDKAYRDHIRIRA